MSVYVFLIFFGLISDKIDSVYFKSTRIFWTMGLPLAPFFMVIFGYYVWRRLCPLSLFAKVGSLIPRTKQRRIPPWFERWGYMVIFGGMYLSLGIRHLFTNGSGVWLSAFLLGIGLCAFVVGAIFTGKTWCNFLCPVAIIEKTYLEPTGMGRGVKADNSQCKRCTACKKHCPDIDVEVGYWKDKDLLSRRMSAYGWPGLVFAFYWVYWTYKGTWDYYFSGVWTREPNEWKNIFGPGFFFAPWVPKICATYLALLAPTLLSWVIFFAIEKLLTKRYGQERAVHWTLSLAAFAAFNLFYIFAGQPTWRKIPGGSQVASFIAVALSTLFLVRRFPRREDESVQEKFAKRFIARWSWKDEKPPEDLREAFYVIKHKEQEKEVGLRVYADTIRELMSEGVLTRAELRIIEQVRTQFNISDQDHEKVLQQLQISDRQLFDPNVAVSAEERLQEQGYRLALRTQLLRGASKRDIDNLRRDYNIPLENHNRIVEEITGSAGGHVQQVHDLLARIEDLRAVYRVLCGFVMGPALEFLSLVLLKRQDRLVDHVLDVLSLMGLGDLGNAALAREIGGALGIDMTYSQPQLAGGVATSATQYGRYLQRLAAGRLQMAKLLQVDAVCTNPVTCPGAINSPVGGLYSWHYAWGHWIEDDPATGGDGSFSSAGAFGFYPWLDAGKTWWGIVARRSEGELNAGQDQRPGRASAACGIRIRAAWMNATGG
jgi:hypothetical protein